MWFGVGSSLQGLGAIYVYKALYTSIEDQYRRKFGSKLHA